MEKKPRSVALLSAGLLAGGAAAGALVVSAANAATADPSLTAASSTYSSPGSSEGPSGSSGESPQGQGHRFAPGQPGQGTNPDEKAVTGDAAAKLKAAAQKAVPGGTVLRVETDSGDAVYEAHMKKSDGSLVTVKFDKGYAVTGVEDGMGKGPGGASGGRHGGFDGQRPSGGGESSSSPSA